MSKLAVGANNFAVLGIGLGVNLHAFGIGLAKEGELPALPGTAAKLKGIERNAQLHGVFSLAAGTLGYEFYVVGKVHLVVHLVRGVVFAHVQLHAVCVGPQKNHVARIAVDVEGDSDKVVFPGGVSAVEVGPKVARVVLAAKGHVKGLIVLKNIALSGQWSRTVVAWTDLPAQRQA